MHDCTGIKCACMNFLRKVGDVLCFAEGHSHGLQLWNACRKDRFGVPFTKYILHPLPDSGLCFGRNLLADDVVYHRREQICIYRSVYMTDAVDNGA